MIASTKLSKDFKKGNEVWKTILGKECEVQFLEVDPHTSIDLHRHDNQWEVTLCFYLMRAYVCLKNEEHELVNNSDETIRVMAIKGTSDYTYDDLGELFCSFGFSVYHGSINRG